MRTLIAGLTFIFLTFVCGTLVIIAKLLGVREGPGSVFDRAPRWWAAGILKASGVRVVLHGGEQLVPGEPHIFVSNHVSWYDVLALVLVLPQYSFVAKAELFKVPLFGSAARAVGTIPIERENRKAAFQSYEEAAVRIRAGRNVVVYPEGTRGTSYALRPFKKGPFVLAIAAGVPIIPTIIHGTIEANPRGTLRVTPGVVDVHLLEPVSTAGLSYDERDALSRAVYERMAEGFRRIYGLESPPYPTTTTAAAPAAAAD
ncbi:1-acyl-sn-glycerol-3-phosphate acyltransferase [Gemmatirosa kalamazoonensis]|uniref:1-acyl-sn-glycerol-3-phosphate acyltransferase n=1 Tax=Gemmatirosa kalamazoonensis TaxID=861299 RepID=W0RJD8_9BACT|nr:lysophospholipid acyltransferase family protein [Gemmatirosa kalamazoonensis]AHG90547.1 1-acyl-sn-glycerol-3-phosphate acyltransferase [Gemmatirosa kalamazoonensis]